MTDNEKLIEEAAREADRRWPSPRSGLYEGLISGFKLGAQWASEKAHTPTEDERDALSTVIAKIREGFYPEGLSAVSNDDLAHAILAAGFRRSEASS